MHKDQRRKALQGTVEVCSGYEYCRRLVEDFPRRVAGTPGERRAAEYIAEELAKAGVQDVALEPFRLVAWDMETVGRVRALEPDLGEFAAYPGFYTGSTPPGGVEGELLYFDSPEDVNWDDPILRGKIVMAYGPWFGAGRLRAAQAGVVCLISVLSRLEAITHLDGRPDAAQLPYLDIGYLDAARIVKAGCKRLRVECKTRIFEAESHNVVGRLPGRDPKAPHLLLGAHYDDVPVTPGATDNAAGVTAVMAAAAALAHHPLRGDLDIALFGAEEPIMVGSKAYVRAHRDRLPQTLLMVYFDGTGDIVGRNRVRAQGHEDLREWAYAVARETGFLFSPEPALQNLDNAWFNYYGIPNVKADRTPQVHYHAPGDDMSLISEKVLLDNAVLTVEWLDRASASPPPFTPGVPPAVREFAAKCCEGWNALIEA